MAKDRVNGAADLFALLLDANQARQDQGLLAQQWRGEHLYIIMDFSSSLLNR